jgi:hypothetical protein
MSDASQLRNQINAYFFDITLTAALGRLARVFDSPHYSNEVLPKNRTSE